MSEIGRPWRGYYLTAYGIAVKHGFVGSESEWLESLQGKDVYTIAVEGGFTGSEAELMEILSNPAESFSVNGSGHLILTRADGTTEDLGNVKGERGATGPKGEDATGDMEASVYDPANGARQVAFADQLPAAYTSAPQMDGTASAGSGTSYARGNHVHPTDTSRAPLASPTFTGTPKAPTAAAATNNTQLATTAFVHSLLTCGTSDLTAGTSELATGVVYLVYE